MALLERRSEREHSQIGREIRREHKRRREQPRRHENLLRLGLERRHHPAHQALGPAQWRERPNTWRLLTARTYTGPA